MSDNEQTFWDVADALISRANQLTETEGKDQTVVSDALLYAAARYAAYVAAGSCEDRKSFKEEYGEIRAMLLEQFTAMLDNNLEDYLENYKLYIEKG